MVGILTKDSQICGPKKVPQREEPLGICLSGSAYCQALQFMNVHKVTGYIYPVCVSFVNGIFLSYNRVDS